MALGLGGCGADPATVALPRDPASVPKFELGSWTLDGQLVESDPLTFAPGQQIPLAIEVQGPRSDYFQYGNQSKEQENNQKPILRFSVQLTRVGTESKAKTTFIPPRAVDVEWTAENRGRATGKWSLPQEPGEYDLQLSYTHYWLYVQPGRLSATEYQVLKDASIRIVER